MQNVYRVVDDINRNSLLSAEVLDEKQGLIQIEFLGRCGDELPSDMIRRCYNTDSFNFISDDTSINIVRYKLGA